MKRFYTKGAMSAVVVATALLATTATAERWHALRPGAEEPGVLKPIKDSERRPAARYLRSIGLTDPNDKLQPVGDGLQFVSEVRGKRHSSTLTRTIQNPRANLYAIMPRHLTMTEARHAKLISINSSALSSRDVYSGAQYCQVYGDVDYAFQGSAYKDGILYVPQAQGGLIPSGYVWNEIELSTGRIVDSHSFDMNSDSQVYSLAWNPAKQVFYGLTTSNDTPSNLVKVDPKDWSLTMLGRVSTNSVGAIIYNPTDTKMYAFDEDNNVMEVDISDGQKNGRAIPVGTLEIDYTVFPFKSGAAAIAYSPMDQCYVAIYRDQENGNAYITIDPETWEVFDIGYISGSASQGFISSIVCTDELAAMEAPELPAMADIVFNTNQLSGKMTVTAPTTTYYGLAIPESTAVKTKVSIDGNVIFTRDLKPGESATFDVNTTEGMHTFTTICSIGEYDSPVRKQTKYVGNDVPVAPTNVSLSGKVLSWRAPGNVGVNLGYVDVAGFTYDVYIDGKKQNASPISGTSYTLDANISQDSHKISVTATSHNRTSAKATIERVFGAALNLPFSVMPTAEQSSLFTVINATNDAFAWMYTTSKNDPNRSGMIYPMSLYEDADDWLVLPLLHFDKSDILYQYSFEVNSVDRYESLESFDIFIGKTTNAEDFTNLIYGIDDYNVTINPKTVAVNFAVPEPGDYYVALHCRSTKALAGKGMFTSNHTVKALDGQNSAVPGNPENVVVNAAPKAALALNITLKLPTVDLIGNPLPADKYLTAHATCGNNTGEISGLPGSEVSFSCNVPALGFNTVEIYISNDNGDGLHTTYRRYVGIDRPLPPQNITYVTSEDNMSMTLSWDAPGEVGFNGGYVDPSQLSYDIYMRTSAQVYETVGSTKNTTYTFSPEDKSLSIYILGPVSVSPGGISQNALFQRDALGTPFEIPMAEEFNTVAFNYSHTLYRFMAEGEYAGSRWENHNGCENYGLPGCQENQGALMAFSESGAPTKACLYLPKAETKGFKEGVNISLKYWDYSLCPSDIEIWGRHSKDQTFKKVHTFKANRPMKGEWVTANAELPAEFHDNSWIELQIRCSLRGGDTEYFVLDNYEIAPLLEHDIKVNALNVPEYIQVGSRMQVRVPVLNSGTERSSVKLRIQLLMPDGNLVEERSTNFTIRPNELMERTVSFDINGDFSKHDYLKIKAIAEADPDEIPSNNERVATVNVYHSQLPTVSSLRGEANREENTASLSWRAPQTSYGNLQDFELETPFQNTESFGGWKNIDVDGGVPSDIGSGSLALNWPGIEQPSAWTVIDPSKTVFKDDARLQAHSGSKCILARPLYIRDEESEQHQASDWLISPELQVGSNPQTISFWYNTISATEKEYVYIWVSFTGNNLDPDKATETQNGDFYRMRPFSKIGEKGWEYVEYELPVGTKYFALVYSSFAASGAMLDDISFIPASMGSWDIDHYAVLRDCQEFGEEVLADNLTETSFIDKEYPAEFGGAKYFVRTYVRDAQGNVLEGPRSNMADLRFDVSGVNAIEILQGVAGGKGEISFVGLAGHTLNVYGADGKLVKVINPTAAYQTAAFEKGLYLVVDGKKTAKVLVK
ncbi:MAG: choice-of-anchor J domain-containing protein [Muribaculaceae bacterium]|nr:choice-of-anchor J domain-containing protein [Muribaculaceae bacterium]